MKCLTFLLLLVLAALRAAEPAIEFKDPAVVTLPDAAPLEKKAAVLLVEEVARRSHLRWRITNAAPLQVTAPSRIIIGQFREMERITPVDREAPALKAEGYTIWATTNPQTVWVAGADPRGVLYGAGRLLRELRIERTRASLPASFKIQSAPETKLRGHQLGYRPKCNSYDGWTVSMWEQYIRDLAIFGCNAIELIPPRSDDDEDSPHFPLPKIDMMAEMSRLAGEYGMDVWIWHPAMDPDYSKPETVQSAIKEWAEVFARLPKVDAVFVPGGDPGHTEPKHLFKLLEAQAANLRKHHPKAQMWMSPQSFTASWMEQFFSLMAGEPAWLSGIVYGPQVRIPLPDLRKQIPAKYPIRDYPDITHTRHSQYFVPDWDIAYALAEGREPINPRPRAMQQIYQRFHQNSVGFITYSEGCNDDVNKTIWSALGWKQDADIQAILQEYARYFVSPVHARDFARGLLMLEENWKGPLARNKQVERTLDHFQFIEREASPAEKLNWRFQQALYRAYYDAYLQKRLIYETDLEMRAWAVLEKSSSGNSSAAMTAAENILSLASSAPVATGLRARVFELAEALFQSIHMQLSVPRYQAIALERGANLDAIDASLNSRNWMLKQFEQIRELPSEAERAGRIEDLLHRTDPGPGGFYDDLGNPEKQPHLVRRDSIENDPPALHSHLNSSIRDIRSAYPKEWWTWAESLYDEPLQVRYTGLDPTAAYRVRVVYGGERRTNRIQMTANGNAVVHPYLSKAFEPLEFDLAPDLTKGGELALSWNQPPGAGGGGRGCAVAEIWLLKR